ncbi:MAG TPA: rod shape-determining protein MreD [Pusillimonas sp.]|uniref:rod shape-determining protein MreD n=1 Tax=Pusillimonas sp. TaxID=3040095 RepID=UPI002B76339E|nr:rod shape-determining protein MreD [Pusillimonas sp.]HUH88987.1 rod shape-determining protein MreD [Pusillimonas sp.]
MPVHGKSSLTKLEPIDVTPFRRPSGGLFIWGSILLVWIISLLPWRLWQPAPDLLLLVILFWCLNEPRRVGMTTAFVFGLLMDVHDAGLMGEQALIYVLAAYGTIVLSRRLLHFSALAQAVHILPIVVASEAVARIVHAWLAGEWTGWTWVWSSLFTVALWPLADTLLHLPQRRRDEIDTGAG